MQSLVAFLSADYQLLTTLLDVAWHSSNTSTTALSTWQSNENEVSQDNTSKY